MSQLVTGDAVLLDLRPARIPTRMLATAIDLALMAGASYLFDYVITTVGGSSARVEAVSLAGTILIMFGYPIAMETLTRGCTVGAYALGLRVVRDDGGGIRFRQALLRGLAFWAVDVSPFTGLCGGLVCAAVNRQSKRFGDLLAGTIVIRTRSPRAARPVPPVPPELAGWAGQLELSGLPDELVTAARHLVQRHDGLLDYPKSQLSTELARQVADHTAPPPPPGTPPYQFLAAVIAERRRREANRPAERQWVPGAADLPAGWR